MPVKNLSCQLFVLMVVCMPSVAMAQVGGGESGRPPVFYQPVPPLPPHFGETYDHDSTAAGNFMRGQASVIHANGNYLLSLTQAQILSEIARSLDIDNREQWISFRAANRNRRAVERQLVLDERRAKNEATRLNRYASAYRLSSQQLDRETGAICWPDALLGDKYADTRSQLDEMFRRNAKFGGGQKERSLEIYRCVERMQLVMRSDVAQLQRSIYLSAQKFLCGLKYEAEFEADNGRGSSLAYRQP